MNTNLESKKYPGHVAESWIESEAAGKPVLRVTFTVEGERVEWTCWLEDMEKDGKPSSNARGLAALGVTREDLQNWARGNELVGLDRREVDLVIEINDKGYPFVKWVNDPREARAAKPLDRGQRVTFAKKAAAALAALGGTVAPAQQAAPPLPRQGRPPGLIEPPRRRPPPSGDLGDDGDLPF